MRSDDNALVKHLAAASRFEAADDLVAALRAYRAALTLDVSCVTALLGVGRISLLLGYNDRAVEDFTRALMAHRDCAEAYLGRGQAFLDLGLLERARTDLEAASRLAPDSLDVRLAYGQLLCEAGEPGRAVELLREARALADDDDIDVALELAWALMCTVEVPATAPDDLIDELREVIARVGDGLGDGDPMVTLLRAGLAALEGDVRRAGEHLEAALRAEPELEARVASVALLAQILERSGAH